MEEIENTRRLEQMGQENADLVNPETEKVTAVLSQVGKTFQKITRTSTNKGSTRSGTDACRNGGNPRNCYRSNPSLQRIGTGTFLAAF